MSSRFKRSKVAVHCLALLGASMSLCAQAETELAAVQGGAKGVEFTLITGDKVSAVVNNTGELGGIRMLNTEGVEIVTSVFKRGNDTYLVPPKAQPFVDSHAIDLELFNINKLYKSNYDDASTDNLPVIIEYTDGTLAGAAAPTVIEGTSLTGEIELIDSAAFGIAKDKAALVWESLTQDGRIEGVWLDAVIYGHKQAVGTTLTPTVPLTGALGTAASAFNGEGVTVAVLDTGYDVEHSDLQGQVIGSKDFSFSSNGVDDLNGHGTHTASTIAGTGAESNGYWAGMAPGADLLIGKVLSNSGGGSTYGIINGMIWAVENGADIVNMSLGGSATACEGPMVDVVEAFRDQALFVISAGNSYTRETVGSPGCAPSALTVAALDRDNQTAVFSSRGPSPDGHSVKPDIGSQGVDVMAAASGGVGSNAYRSMSGTSMSAPHVAGGAAIVLQARPDLSPVQLKRVLTSSVSDNDAHVLEQGAGPMDVNRAITQPVIAAPNVELGRFVDVASAVSVEAYVTLTNISDSDVSYKLSMDLIGEDGKTQLPATLAGLGVKSVTVPANGSVDVPVWIEPQVALRDGAYGTISGRIHGESIGQSDEQITVPVSFFIQPPEVELTLNAYDNRGKPATSISKAYIISEEDDWGRALSFTNGQASISVPQGNYSVISHIVTYDNDSDFGGLPESAAQMAYLDHKVTSDTVLTFDAGMAEKVEFKADKPIDTQGFSFGFTYALDDNKVAKLAAIDLMPDYVENMYLWSQGHDDRFRSFVSTHATAPETVLSMENGQQLHAVAQGLAVGFDGEGSAEVVPVGDAAYNTDWSQFDLAGKIALIQNPYYATNYMVKNAMNQGAIGVLFYRPGTHGRYKTAFTGIPTKPVVGLSAEEGEMLFAEIQSGRNKISWSGTAVDKTPYTYQLHHITDGHNKGGLIRVHDKDMYHISAAYHAQGEEIPVFRDMMAQTNSTGEFYSTGSPQMLIAPVVRDEYYTATSKNTWTNIVMPASRIQAGGAYFDGPRIMPAGEKEETTWLKGPKGASLNTSSHSVGYRDTNLISWNFPQFGDSSGHDAIAGFNGSSAYGLWVNGESTYMNSGTLTMPVESAEVRLELRNYNLGVAERSPIGDKLGSFYQGIFTFMTDQSMQGAQPILVPQIDVPVDMHNSHAAGEPAKVVLSGAMDSSDDVNLAEVTLQYAYGQECLLSYVFAYSYCPVYNKLNESDWVDAEVAYEDGQWVATVPNDAEAGEFVHLRVVMSDEGASSAQVTTMRAYMLK
ncbi:S8 family serine peptidase [Vibrio sp. YIC-376]|uniref:S8 family serine peptidase n=1 Tax=Vibrio sp. YIC-376 TaxID=3136162 RepID=UPI00402A944C